MKKIEWNRVTPLSKTLAGVLFIAFPILAFWLGAEYGELKQRAKSGIEIIKQIRSYAPKPVNQLPQAEPNFEGEADPARMTLGMTTWRWTEAQVFTLTFNANGRVAIGTDCNSMGGSYTTDGNKITFSEIASTLMYCEGSRESEFASLIQRSQSYRFTSRGELILELKSGGSATFR